ncbi:MAG: anaerobic ribonucleoside-triphosphate reductase activating protein [Deltaproteobacteria bacterium]|nr:MAG: anaerobic ribonucleoside-triphosphate reductase activating protein [Deltaproteobacteria bacterium]
MNGLPAVKGFIETSFVDWQGRMASVVFLPRCNFRCPYCHNHRLVTDPEQYRTLELEGIFAKLEGLRGWVDGVCISGGEPTIHTFLPQFLEEFKARGWPVKLDTNGSKPKMVETILMTGLAEAFSVDVKAPLESIPYRKNAGRGADPASVARTLAILADWGVDVEVRTTVHPALLTVDECVRLRTQVSEIFGRPVKIKWQLCRGDDTLDPSLASEHALKLADFDRLVEEIEEA